MHKKEHFKNKVIIVDGFSVTGKTILPPILDAYKSTLLPTFSHELEWFCMLWAKGEITSECFTAMISNICDYRIYKNLLGREVNTRFSDLSAIWKSTKLFEIIKRIIIRLGDK